MGSWETDPSPSAGAGQMRQPTFATVFRGYDPNQVLEYLSRVADHVEALESTTRQLESELQEARRQGVALQERVNGPQDPYDAISARVADLLRMFDHDVEKLRAEAEAEVDRLLADARKEADRIRLDAQDKAAEIRAEAERTLRDARVETERALSGLASRRDSVLNELRSVRDRLLDTVKDLEVTVEGSARDHLVLLEEARTGEPAETTPPTPSPARPDSGA